MKSKNKEDKMSHKLVTAGLTLALAEGHSLDQAVRFANAAGAITVTRLGTMAAMPTRSEIDALLASQTARG